MNAIGPLLVRCRLDASPATFRSHASRCFFSSAIDRAGAAKRNVNWLLLTLVVWQTSSIGASGLSFNQFRSCSTRATNASALLAERVIKHGNRSDDGFLVAAGVG